MQRKLSTAGFAPPDRDHDRQDEEQREQREQQTDEDAANSRLSAAKQPKAH
jgi:hypothetical protein